MKETIKVNAVEEIPSNYTGIVEFANGTKNWFKDGKVHREDGPAVEWANGDRGWYKNGEPHREDGPAFESVNGSKEWYLEDQYYPQINLEDYKILNFYKGKNDLIWYRLLDEDEVIDYPDIPGLIEKNMLTMKIFDTDQIIVPNFTGVKEYSGGNKFWFKDGKQHREVEPAVELINGDKFWWINGKRHREDGPAIEAQYGRVEWWLEDEQFLPINLNNYVVLDSYKGKYDLNWYKIIDEDEVIDYPDIPGLIEK